MESMESDEIERTVLSSITSPVDLQTLRNLNLSAQSFVFNLAEADFIWEYVTKYGNGPTAEVLQGRFPEFKHCPLDNFDYICRVFRNEYARRTVMKTLGGHKNALDKDADQAITSLVSALLAVQLNEDNQKHIVDATNVQDKLQRYKDRIKGFDKRRLEWGINPLDTFPLRFTTGQFVGLIADTKSGKSWFALKIALANYMNGRRVGIISPELSVPDIEDRVDTVLANMFKHPIRHDYLSSGVTGIEENYQKYLEQAATKNRRDLMIYPYNTATRITPQTTIAGILGSDNLDLLVIDGIYMVEDDHKERTSWDQMRKKCQDLKTLSTATETALLVTNQTGRDRDANSDHAAPALASMVAGGYDFNRFVDILISLGGNPGTADTRQIAVPLVRNQRSLDGNYEVTFDTNTGDIGRTIGAEPPMGLGLMDL